MRVIPPKKKNHPFVPKVGNEGSLDSRFSSGEDRFSSSDRKAIDEVIVLARELTGVQLGERHYSMINSRLSKRLSELQISSLRDYLDYFYVNRKEEAVKLIGLLTTHHTYFFREFSHFEFLISHALPELVSAIRSRRDNVLRIWAAACSRGQEVYSLAMYLDVHLKRFNPNIRYEILGTDIDPESVEVAKNGVYPWKELKEIPLPLLGDHWIRGTGDVEGFAKVKNSLRDRCRFHTANLLELRPGSTPAEKFDLIFCRNVFIYFNPEQIRSITLELLSRLTPEGFFFIGISESLSGLKLPVGSPGPSIYRHKAQHELSLEKTRPAQTSLREKVYPVQTVRPAEKASPTLRVSQPLQTVVAGATKPIRMLLVDDSPTILTMLKRILSKDHGFEIVGVANNGIEAAKQVSALKPDALTLDIHMPEQTGIEYLEKNFKPGHPPVIMVTSVSRENVDLAGRALNLGAADYVEKPAMANITERGEEIRNKIRCALLTASNSLVGGAPRLVLDRSFQKPVRIDNPLNKLRLVVLPLSARPKFKLLLSELVGIQPPTVLFVEGSQETLPAMAEVLSKDWARPVRAPGSLSGELKPGEIILLDPVSAAEDIFNKSKKDKKVSILVFGDVSKTVAEKISLFKGANLVLEDLGGGKGAPALMNWASDIVPHTSFAYLSTECFADQPGSKRKLVAS